MRTRAREAIAAAFAGNSLKARFAKGAFWSFVGTAAGPGLELAASIPAARLLGTDGFGELGMVRSTVGMFGIFAGLGLALTATKHVAELRHQDPERAGRIVGLSTVVAVVSAAAASIVFLIAAPYLAEHTLNRPDLVGKLRLGCGLLFFNAVQGAQIGALAGFEAFRTIAMVNLVRGGLLFPLVWLGAWRFGVMGAVAGLVIATGAASLASHGLMRREARMAGVRVFYRGWRREAPLLWQFSLPALVGSAVVVPAQWLTRTMLVNTLAGYGALGVFEAAFVFQNALRRFGDILGSALLPILASPTGAASERFGRVNMLFSWVIGALPALPLLLLPELISLAYGDKFSGLTFERTGVLVMLGACLVAYRQGLARVLAAKNLLWWGCLDNTVWSVLLLGSFAAMTRWGATGLAGAFVVAYALNTLVFVPLYARWGLVPHGTIVSWRAGVVWLVVAAFSLAAYAPIPLLLRLIALPIGLAIALHSFAAQFFGPRRAPASAEAE